MPVYDWGNKICLQASVDSNGVNRSAVPRKRKSYRLDLFRFLSVAATSFDGFRRDFCETVQNNQSGWKYVILKYFGFFFHFKIWKHSLTNVQIRQRLLMRFRCYISLHPSSYRLWPASMFSWRDAFPQHDCATTVFCCGDSVFRVLVFRHTQHFAWI